MYGYALGYQALAQGFKSPAQAREAFTRLFQAGHPATKALEQATQKYLPLC